MVWLIKDGNISLYFARSPLEQQQFKAYLVGALQRWVRFKPSQTKITPVMRDCKDEGCLHRATSFC